MFSWFKPKPKTTADEKLEQIVAVLFPQMTTEIDKEGNKFHVDSSADMNLDSALVDLEEGHNDEVSRKTIKDVSDRLYKVRKIVESYQKLDKDAKYILVENLDKKEVDI